MFDNSYILNYNQLKDIDDIEDEIENKKIEKEKIQK